jgi:hypothetical protein
VDDHRPRAVAISMVVDFDRTARLDAAVRIATNLSDRLRLRLAVIAHIDQLADEPTACSAASSGPGAATLSPASRCMRGGSSSSRRST